ncbi:MAG: PAC2 family protein [Dehalococcoidia bacterium]|nr:PAC2 family protein [Dehalococcoidia bacterium]
MENESLLNFTEVFQKIESLRDPIMLASFVRRNGFNTTAVTSLSRFAKFHDAQVIATLAPEDFYDFSVTPPVVSSEDGKRLIEWPKNEIFLIRSDRLSRDILVMTGVEPHLKWPTFSNAVHNFIKQQSIQDLLVVRTWPGAVPHTRPVLIRLTTKYKELARALDLPDIDNDYSGPVDIGGVLSSLQINSGGHTGGLTAVVPNYLGVVPNPLVVLALVEIFDRVAGTETNLSEFESAANDLKLRADQEMSSSEEFRRALEEMESSYEEVINNFTGRNTANPNEGELPSSDDILRDVEKFLRSND